MLSNKSNQPIINETMHWSQWSIRHNGINNDNNRKDNFPSQQYQYKRHGSITNKAVKFNRQRPINKSDVYAKVILACLVCWTLTVITVYAVNQLK